VGARERESSQALKPHSANELGVAEKLFADLENLDVADEFPGFMLLFPVPVRLYTPPILGRLDRRNGQSRNR
jgi:hypothetical protein